MSCILEWQCSPEDSTYVDSITFLSYSFWKYSFFLACVPSYTWNLPEASARKYSSLAL